MSDTGSDAGWAKPHGASGKQQCCCVHIGYHRCASSFLQTKVFDALPGYQRGSHDVKSVCNDVAEWAKTSAAAPHKPVFSSESLSSDTFADRLDLPSRFYALNPSRRILIVIRSQ